MALQPPSPPSLSSSRPELSGRVALVTGAQHGIGAATAKALAARGAALFIHYLRGPAPEVPASDLTEPGTALYQANQAKSADDVLQAIHEAGGRASAWESDLSDPANIPALFDRVEQAFGSVDILVNNAAVGGEDTFVPAGGAPANEHIGLRGLDPLPITAGSHDRLFAVNSRATAVMMAEFARRHAERGASWGRIINLSTDGAYCFSGEVSYGASKAAVEAYSRAAAKELGQYGITVNIVSPGPIQTGYVPRELERRIAAATPLGRVGLPDDVADVIAFLASDQARWLTGQLLHVGGGHVM